MFKLTTIINWGTLHINSETKTHISCQNKKY